MTWKETVPVTDEDRRGLKQIVLLVVAIARHRIAAARDLETQLAEARELLARIRTETIGSKVAGGDGQTYAVVPLSGNTLNDVSAFLSRTGSER